MNGYYPQTEHDVEKNLRDIKASFYLIDPNRMKK